MATQKRDSKKKYGKIIDAILVLFIVFMLGSIVYAGMIRPFRVVLTGSMEPTIKPGDVVFVKKVNDPSTLTPGDIVMYTRPGYKEPIVHRIIQKTTWEGQVCFVIKGDNNPAPDPPYPGNNGEVYPCVPGYAIEGKVVHVFHGLGKPLLWLFSH